MHVDIEVVQDALVLLEILTLFSGSCKIRWSYLAQKPNGIVSNLFPQVWIKYTIERTRFGTPASP
jgi:hypothetical protein